MAASIYRNYISSLGSNALGGINSLTVLRLKNNCIQAVDDGAFVHCEFLQELDVSGNALQKIPDLSGMLYIQKLSCQENCIQSVKNLVDISCTIRNLNLSFNCIQELFDLRLGCWPVQERIIGKKGERGWTGYCMK